MTAKGIAATIDGENEHRLPDGTQPHVIAVRG